MLKKRILIGLSALLFMMGVCPLAAMKKEDVQVHTLPNGLKVLLVPDHNIPNIAFYTFFRVGSRNERVGLTGISHFIEHMMFNGTAKYAPGEFDRVMEFAGGRNNAYTGNDFTAYTDWFPAAALEPMIKMEADRMQGLVFDPKVLESERGVVASERRMSVENNNSGLLDETVTAMAIMAHPYHWGVIGWMSDIMNWRREDIMEYYRRYYAPNNAVLVIMGDFEPESALALVKKYYTGIPAGAPPPKVTTTEPPQLGTRRLTIRKEAQVPLLQIVFHAPAAVDPDFMPLRLLQMALLNGESCRLYRKLVRDEQVAIDVSGSFSESFDPYLLTINIEPKLGTDLGRLEELVLAELQKIQKDGIDEQELQKAKNQVRSGYFRQLQTIAQKANLLGRAEMFYGGYDQVFTMVDRYNAVKREQVQEVAKKYFQTSDMTVGTLVPAGGNQ